MVSPIKLVGMMTVRNEEDIVEKCLNRAVKYHDAIYVVDCGSDDRTPEIVNSIATRFSEIEFLGEISPRHSRQVKRHIWDKFRHSFSNNDWWSVIDADELLEEDPKPFIQSAEAELADHIFSKIANFYTTDLEVDEWFQNREEFENKEIEDRMTYYRMHTSQVRMFRNLPWLRWNEDTHLPRFLAKPATHRPVYRHYQYRSPAQIEKRLRTRREWAQDSAIATDNPHWDKQEWRQAVAPADDLNLKKAVHGSPLEPDPSLPQPNQKQFFLKTVLKYTYAILIGISVRQDHDNLLESKNC